MKILYFTATGNSLYIAKSIGGDCYSIPQLIKEGKFDFEDEKIGIVFPDYFGGVPKLIEKFLDKVKLKSNYVFGIITYGKFSGAATRHLLEIGKRNSIEFSYINEICMVDNYLPGFDMNKQIKNQGKKKIEENLQNIIKDINNEQKYISKKTILREFIRIQARKVYDKPFEKNFFVENSCNGCKTCEKVCPVDNIKVDKKPIFQNNCQQCLACVHNCPSSAISLKNQRSKARFTNENVALKEIINSNR